MTIKEAIQKLVPAALLLVMTSSQAGVFSIQTGSSCAQLPRKELFNLINEIGIQKGLNFPKNQRIRAELRCVPAGENLTYMYRITHEKTSNENNAVWVNVLDEKISYGVLSENLMIDAIKQATQSLNPR